MAFACCLLPLKKNAAVSPLLLCLCFPLLAAAAQAGNSGEEGPPAHQPSEAPAAPDQLENSVGTSGGNSDISPRVVNDLLQAFQAAPSYMTIDLPNSHDFSEAFRKYTDTGICKRWTDGQTGQVRQQQRLRLFRQTQVFAAAEAMRQETGALEEQGKTISTGMSDAALYAAVGERPRDMKFPREELQEAWDNGEVWRLIKLLYRAVGGALPVAALGLGLLLLLLWLFVFVWQMCLRCCRRALCCCKPPKQRRTSACWFLWVVGVLGLSLSVLSFLFMGVSLTRIQAAVGSLGSAACAMMEMAHHVEWGATSSSEKLEITYLLPGITGEQEGAGGGVVPFAGVRGMAANINGLAALFSPDYEMNIVNILKKLFEENADTKNSLAGVSAGGKALRENVEVFENETKGTYMKSLLAVQLKSANFTYEKPILTVYDKYKEKVNEVLDSVTLKELDFANDVDLADMEEVASELQKTGADVAGKARPAAKLAPLLLSVEAALVVSGVVLAVVALVVYLVSRSKQSMCFNALTWNWMMVTLALSLVTTGILFLVSSGATQICNASVDSIWELNPSEGEGSGEPGTDEPGEESSGFFGLEGTTDVLAECVHNPKYNFLEAQGLDEDIEDAKKTIKKVEKNVMEVFQPFPEVQAFSYPRELQKWVDEFGTLVVFDKEALKNHASELANTFDEMLQSGVQDTTKNVTVTLVEELKKSTEMVVYGMDMVKELVHPAGIKGYSEATDGNILITESYPNDTDPTFTDWLNKQKEGKKKQLADSQTESSKAEEEAEKYKKQLKNAVLLTVLKLKLLNSKMDCFRPTSSGVVEEKCTGRELFVAPQRNLIAKSASVFSSSFKLGSSHRDCRCFLPGEYVEDVFPELSGFVDNIKASYNCAFLRENLLETIYLLCHEGADNSWKAALGRFISQAIALLLAVLIFVLWRLQRDNKESRERASEEASPASADEGESEIEKQQDSGCESSASPLLGGQPSGGGVGDGR
ncbi:hypothetical protein Efla_006258 [Eimeria flavescens]